MPKRNLTLKDEEKLKEIKLDMCRIIRRYAYRKYGSNQKFARHVGISMETTAFILRRYVDRLTFNQLFIVLVKLAPHFRMMIAYD